MALASAQVWGWRVWVEKLVRRRFGPEDVAVRMRGDGLSGEDLSGEDLSGDGLGGDGLGGGAAR